MTTPNATRSVAISTGDSNLEAIRARLRMAFPEVATCFPSITSAGAANGDWRQALESYVDRLSDTGLALVPGSCRPVLHGLERTAV